MNYYNDMFLKYKGNRDTIFNYALALLNNKMANILEIGVARDLNPRARCTDGWSSMHFAQYIAKNGGKLHLVDVSQDSVSNCIQLITSISNFSNYESNIIDGVEYLSNTSQNFDLVLLDGSDNPEEMLQCFELVKNRASYIICDDFHAKGSLLKAKYPEFTLFYWSGCSAEMALYNICNPSTQKIEVPHLELENK